MDEPPNTKPCRQRGGQPENRNALRHGLAAGKLPADAAFIEVRLNGFRRRLEDAVVAERGAVTLQEAAVIQTALRWERHAALAQRWLTKAGDELKPVERLTFSREIARASTERDKALGCLRLDRDRKQDLIATLYSAPRITDLESDDDGPA